MGLNEFVFLVDIPAEGMAPGSAPNWALVWTQSTSTAGSVAGMAMTLVARRILINPTRHTPRNQRVHLEANHWLRQKDVEQGAGAIAQQ